MQIARRIFRFHRLCPESHRGAARGMVYIVVVVTLLIKIKKKQSRVREVYLVTTRTYIQISRRI